MDGLLIFAALCQKLCHNYTGVEQVSLLPITGLLTTKFVYNKLVNPPSTICQSAFGKTNIS
jgi:hypothetical protein